MRERLGGAPPPWPVLRAVDDVLHVRVILREVLVFRKKLSKNLAAHGRTVRLKTHELGVEKNPGTRRKPTIRIGVL